MNLFEKIDDVLDQEAYILPKKEKDIEEIDYLFQEEVMFKIADFIINLDPDRLNDSQLDSFLYIINELKLRKPRMAKRTPMGKLIASKKWYRTKRTHVKRREKKLDRSAEGKRRENRRDRLARQNKTPTKRERRRYHVRKKSKRRDSDANLNR